MDQYAEDVVKEWDKVTRINFISNYKKNKSQLIIDEIENHGCPKENAKETIDCYYKKCKELKIN
jgi:hypothetical protein